jgi:hypothetical protein
VNVTNVTNVYNTTVINNHTTNVSYNGGTGGTTAQPTAAEQVAAHERHIAPTTMQMQHQQTASSNRALLASANHGQPTIAASPKAGVFSGQGVVAASKANTTNPGGGKDGFKPFSATKTAAGNNGPNSGNGNGGSSGKGFGGGNGNGNDSYKPSNASVAAGKVNSAHSSSGRDDFKPLSATKTAGGNNGSNPVYGNNGGGSGKGFGAGNGSGNGSYKPGNASVSDMRMRGNNHMASAPPPQPPHSNRSSGGQQHHNNESHENQKHKTER